MDISDLTDTELRAHLRAKMPAANWTLHEMIEIERRGAAVLEPEPDLAEAFAARQEATLAPFREAFKKFDAGIKGIGNGQLDFLYEPLSNPDAERHYETLGALQAIAVHVGEVEKHTRRGRFEWVQFAFVVLGVVASLVALL